MEQPEQGERAHQADALLGRVDADHVDLADGLVAVRRRPGMAAVDLGPVETRQPPLALGEEEAIRVEPGLLFAEVEVGARPGALLGVACEGPAADRGPWVLVRCRPGR